MIATKHFTSLDHGICIILTYKMCTWSEQLLLLTAVEDEGFIYIRIEVRGFIDLACMQIAADINDKSMIQYLALASALICIVSLRLRLQT